MYLQIILRVGLQKVFPRLFTVGLRDQALPLPLPLDQAILGAVLIIVLGALAVRTRAMDFGGFVAGFFVGMVVLVGGGWTWFALVLVFFVLAAPFTRFKYEYKRSLGVAQEKGGARGWPNTIANGGAAAVFAALENYASAFGHGGSLYAVAFLGAVAAATADTLATEIGLLSKTPPRLIVHLKKIVLAGTSGGITLLGEFTTLLSSLLIGLLAAILRIVPVDPVTVVTVATLGGFTGSLVDSVLGATVQGVFRCEVCGSVTESFRHHGKPALHLRGIRFLDNNGVNFLGTMIGSFIALAAFVMLSP